MSTSDGGTVDVVALRRALHRIPELGFTEHATSALLSVELSPWATPRSMAGTGLTFDIGPAGASRTLMLRADMDGLPVREESGLPFSSSHEGRMHACGHDAHMAALVTASRELDRQPPADLRVRCLFQPAEEGCGGATRCIEQGVLEGVDAAFGIHVWNELPVGTVAVTPGGIMAGVVEISFRIAGQGGHGALPDRTHDPVVAAAQLVLALQPVVSRRTSPFESAVLTIGSVHAGEAFNVIPDTARILGTVRSFSREAEDRLEADIRRVASGVSLATGTAIEVGWTRYAGPTVNDPRMASLVARAAEDVPGIETVLTDYKTMAGEDFGEFLERVPGCYVLLGSAPAGGGEPHHSPRFVIDERVLPLASALHGAVAARFAAEWPAG